MKSISSKLENNMEKDNAQNNSQSMEQFEKYIKEYLKKGFMQEEYVVDAVKEIIRGYMANDGFSDKKVTDVPNDAYAIVNRRFVTLNGATASRPLGSVLGQRFFDTTITKPVYWSGSTWVDSAGSPA